MDYLVIKFGGSVIQEVHTNFFKNIVSLMEEYAIQPIVVHGGGPTISSLLQTLEVETKFIDGMRVTDNQVLDVAEMVLSGLVNKEIVRKLITSGGNAIGLSGADGAFLQAEPLNIKQDLGYVGKITSVNTSLLNIFLDQKMIPVISPIAVDLSGQRWNINADLAAASIAKELQAPLCLITNVSGVMKNGSVLPYLTDIEIERLIEDGTITGGMIPKVRAAIECLREGINEVVILNGADENVLIDYINGKKVGTSIKEAEMKRKIAK